MEAVLKYCKENAVPMPSTDAWCEFNERRRTTVLGHQSWDPASGVLHVQVESASGLPGATVALPAHHAGRRLQHVTLGSEGLTLHHGEMQERDCVLAIGDIGPGRHCLIAHYS
jgi:hypothetical protein